MDTTPSVIVYSAEWCAYCKTEKQYLDKLGVHYTVKDIEKTPGAQDELAAKTGGKAQGIPVTDIAGEIVYGFDRARIDELLTSSLQQRDCCQKHSLAIYHHQLTAWEGQ